MSCDPRTEDLPTPEFRSIEPTYRFAGALRIWPLILAALVIPNALLEKTLGQINLNPPNQLLPNSPNRNAPQNAPANNQTLGQPSGQTAGLTGNHTGGNGQNSSPALPTPLTGVNQAPGFRASTQPVIRTAQQPLQAETQAPPISPAAAQSPVPNPQSAQVSDGTSITPDAVLTVIQQLQAAADLEPSLKQTLLSTYEAILVELKSRAENEKLTKDFLVAYEAAPAATVEAKKRKENPTQRSLFSNDELESYEIETLKSMQLEIQGLAQAATDARTRVEAAMVSREAKRKDIPRSIADDKAVIVKLNEELALPSPEGLDPRVREASTLLLRSKLLAVNERIRRLEQEQRTFDAEAELIPIRKELLLVEEKHQLAKLKEVKEELGKRRENQIAEQKRMLEDLISGTDPEVKARASSLLKRSEDWLQLAKQNASLRMENDSARMELKLWSDRYKIMTERISPESNRHVSNFNSWVGLMLRKQRNELPDVSELRKKLHEYQSKILTNETLILELDDWKASSNLADELAGGSEPVPSDASIQFPQASVREQKRILNAMEHKLVDEFRLDANSYSDNLFGLAKTNQQTIDQVISYRSFIDENVLWIRSCEPISKSDLKMVWPSLQWFFDLENWRPIPVVLFKDLKSHPWAYGFGICCFAILVFNLKRLKQHIQQQGKIANRPNCTTFLPTAKVLLDCFILSSPLALLHLVIGWRLLSSSEGNPFVESIATGLIVSARYFFPLEMIRQICRANGLADNHFSWPETTTKLLRHNLRWFIDLAIPAVAIVGIVSQFGEAKFENSLGRLTYSLLMSLCFIELAILLHPKKGIFSDFLVHHSGGWIDRLRFFWYAILVFGPTALMAMSLMGYHYTAIRLAMHLHTTFITLIGLLLLSSLIRRWLLLQRRQIVVSQARQRLEEARRRDPGSNAIPASTSTVSAVDAAAELAEINAQTTRLVVSTLIFAAIGAVAFIWSAVLPAVGVLETVELWTVDGATPAERKPITLAHMLIAIPTIVMTVVGARNLPGLLEIALLQHLPLENAVRYAIASLSRYAILILGIAMTFNSIGVRWASIQWLVAALGVGLGFGLQEIFANFVSGLILLFEQPIRVGDVITIGETTGHVSRIRMRATTVTNFDQQELVIPNKDLITGRLLNWTLSDSTNRITIQVGVSYKTDPDVACQLLREICNSHPNVLREPAPTAFFEQFGDSTLNLKARLFLASLDERLPTQHALHAAILQKFTEAGIEISFPQRDLHLRSIPSQLSDLLLDSNRRKAA